MKKISPEMIAVPAEMLLQWQSMVDVMTNLSGASAGLVMRIETEDIEVFLSSEGETNPYTPGDREHLIGSGLYCETVITTRKPLLVSDALADPDWQDNPDVKLNMISYLGFPILMPDGTPFGTICILDNKRNEYSPEICKMMEPLRDLIQAHLENLFLNAVMGEKNKKLVDYLEDLQTLRGLMVVCASCKKIKDKEGFWNTVEKYLIHHPEAEFTHGYCPDCFDEAIDKLDKP